MRDLKEGDWVKALYNFSSIARHVTNQMTTLAEALRVTRPTLPVKGDYVRVIQGLDPDFGKVAQVLWVDYSKNPLLCDVQILVDPFGDTVKIRRPIDPIHIRILCEMEVIAEAAR